MNRMERIDRKYAIIYVDRNGEALSEADLTTPDMINNYYDNPGPLQWNYYYILAQEALDATIDAPDKQDIEANDNYTRKYVMPEDHIYDFISRTFPLLADTHGQIHLIKGADWADAKDKAKAAITEPEHNHRSRESVMFGFRVTAMNGLDIIPSYYRNKSLAHALSQMDDIRARLVTDPDYRALFYTHISTEHHLAEKKFHLFTPGKLGKQKEDE